MVKVVSGIFIVVLICSCGLTGFFQKERLRLKRVDQSTAIENLKLNIDGIYVYDQVHSWGFSRSFFYLFKNGICYVAGYSANNEHQKKNAEDIFINQSILPQDAPLNWGVYHIKNDSIYLEYWTIIKDNMQYNRVRWKGRIVDNETIVIERGWTLKDETVFHFQALKHKPDSTNKFIK